MNRGVKFALVLTMAAVTVPAVAADFNPDEVFLPGELYQFTRSWPNHDGVTVVRLNTDGGPHVPILDSESAVPVYATYDPYRNALVAMHDKQQAFVLVDAAGGFTLEPFVWPYVVATFAATGDGRIYLVDQNAGYMGFIDASGSKCPSGQVCDLLDFDDSPFVLGAGQPRNMIYDGATNSLILPDSGPKTVIWKLQLSLDGTKLVVPVETASYDAYLGKSETPLGISAGPDRSIFVKVRANAYVYGAKMFLVDPTDLAFEAFALSDGVYVAGSYDGTYSSGLERGVDFFFGTDLWAYERDMLNEQEGVSIAEIVGGDASHIVSIGDTIANGRSLAVTLPPPSLQLHKWNLQAVPGRVVEYHILLENRGTATDGEGQLIEVLNDYYAYDSADPAPSEVTNGKITWDVEGLAPGEVRIFTYRAVLDPSVAIGQTVTGGVCSVPIGDGFETECALACDDSLGDAVFIQCVMNCCSGCYCDEKEDEAVGPLDPNEKASVAGPWIRPDETLVFAVHFENVGTVEAQDVFITDVLDTDLDLTSVELITPGGSLDVATRTVSWALLGINLQAGEGDTVLFKVRPLPGLAGGTEIRNEASIQFEVFAPIVTNEIIHTIDTQSPNCVMDPVPPITTDPQLELSWSGEDALGELVDYSIFVSVDGGPFTTYLTHVTTTSSSFAGQVGHGYEFICVARDAATNVEVQGPVGEIAVHVTEPSGSVSAGGPAALQVDLAANGDVILTWGSSCTGTDEDYEIYEGSSPTNYESRFCTTGGATTISFAALAGTSHFIVVPRNNAIEGSYGTDSSGNERPQGTSACLAQIAGSCP